MLGWLHEPMRRCTWYSAKCSLTSACPYGALKFHFYFFLEAFHQRFWLQLPLGPDKAAPPGGRAGEAEESSPEDERALSAYRRYGARLGLQLLLLLRDQSAMHRHFGVKSPCFSSEICLCVVSNSSLRSKRAELSSARSCGQALKRVVLFLPNKPRGNVNTTEAVPPVYF